MNCKKQSNQSQKALIFDPFSGASGDMIIASLIDIGADSKKIVNAMKLVSSVSVSINRVNKNEIDATNVTISTIEESSKSYNEIVEIIKNTQLPQQIKEDTIAIFSILHLSEKKIHGNRYTHFHEVGQSDAIADVIGASVAIRDLAVNKIYCMPITVGNGLVNTAHGKLPIPTPATLEILAQKNMLFKGGFEGELLTPTGAAILIHFASPLKQIPLSKIISIGYGAGDKEFSHSNVLRSMIVELEDSLIHDSIEILETTVDDVTGEVLGKLIEDLLIMGAKDATISPIIMKKGRPGHIIRVIVKSKDSELLARKIIAETGSLGIRVIQTCHRLIVDRHINSVKITIGDKEFEIKVKIAKDANNNIFHISAEFEDCKIVSNKCNIPIKEVIRITEQVAWDVFNPNNS
jgi:uncharacterized protein (TIGR00299 family) protein